MNPRSLLYEAALRTPPPAHMKRQSKRYKKGQTFNVERFAEICNEHQLDPAEAAVTLLQRPDVELKDKEKLEAYIKLMEYLYSKRKAIEHTGKDGGPLKVEIAASDANL